MKIILTDDKGRSKRIYPPDTILWIIRAALSVLAVTLVAVAMTVNSYAWLPHEWHRVPFLFCAVLAVAWAWGVCHLKLVTFCASILSAAFVLRGAELAVFGPDGIRFVAAANWTLLGIWCFLLGIIDQVTVSQKKAGDICDNLSPSSP